MSGVRIAQLFSDVNDAVASVLIGPETADVRDVAGACDYVLVAEGDDVGGRLHLFLGQHGRPLEERGDRRVGNGWDCSGDRVAAQARLEAQRTALDQPDLWPTVAVVGQGQLVAWIHEMRIMNVWIDVPDFRPVPWNAQVHGRDTPESIAALVRIGHRRVRIQLRDWCRGGLRGAGIRGR